MEKPTRTVKTKFKIAEGASKAKVWIGTGLSLGIPVIIKTVTNSSTGPTGGTPDSK